jgi:hypothetical protein
LDDTTPPSLPAASHHEATLDALDLAFWDAIKDSQAPEELSAYLEQHPDGHFSALARARLLQLDDGGSSEAALMHPETQDGAIELAFWESIRAIDGRNLLEAYLEKYPEGQFAVIARARLDASNA